MQDAPQGAVIVVIRKALENPEPGATELKVQPKRARRSQSATQAAEVVLVFRARQRIQAVRDFRWLHVN